MKRLGLSLLFLFLTLALEGQVRVATMNCYLLFKPGIEHRGKVDDKHPMSADTYREKVNNLANLVKNLDFVGLQEIGGRAELEDLARAGGYRAAYAPGKDTFTGEEVGALYKLNSWQVRVQGRVPSLDRLLSKHLLVTATQENRRVAFLVVHLIRPIGANAQKHQEQLDAITSWAKGLLAQDQTLSIIVLGDTNDDSVRHGSSLLGLGIEANELTGFAPTHLVGKPFDRLILIGRGSWSDAEITRPPYSRKPNELQKTLWTDHFPLQATLRFDGHDGRE
jgi:endonuclease/exonuclease/phosphatase family metal-dependent hydrolase